MAEIVAALGLPHTPTFATTVDPNDSSDATAALFSTLAGRLDAADVDTLVIFDSDHLNTFFLDNWPTFAIGMAESTTGPNDATPGLPATTVPIAHELACGLHASVLDEGFDVTRSHEFGLDHSVLIPLHFLRSQRPIVPVFLNGLVPPLPRAARCAALGSAVARAVRDLRGARRVALVASGSFSLEVGGPRLAPGRIFGVPDPAWTNRVSRFLAAGDVGGLIAASDPDQLARAGNVGGELLNWIAVAAAAGSAPAWIELQEEFGHAYAWWDLET